MPKFSTLVLGTRNDADRWRKGMKDKFNCTESVFVKNPLPTVADVSAFFSQSDDWIYLGGHFAPPVMYNEQQTLLLTFKDDRVIVERTETGTKTTRELRKNVEFKQHANLKAVFWGGCSVAEPATIATLRKLFGAVTIVGWRGKTGWELSDMTMGGWGNPPYPPNPPTWRTPNFWDALGAHTEDPVRLRNAWLSTARAINWGPPKSGEPSYLSRFCVVDPDGKYHYGDDEPLVA